MDQQYSRIRPALGFPLWQCLYLLLSQEAHDPPPQQPSKGQYESEEGVDKNSGITGPALAFLYGNVHIHQFAKMRIRFENPIPISIWL